ncbi:MAG TPA: bifunctional 4-hydroxy-2-oxoglutarate aldolase/2-dehydro-3-deoxy-phosphogluconate aldolase [Spirochaetota bacterium]|nr:bifunctional 4-hydroxy-2-oxoglutarate aldolase/2-dehydro-3-deoxy-phosphogluconate aldolase [Spirochaetota bacterium]HOS38547.1 bifunctional 4-hydroxy-2-oxoglutarate aldolase/2-dehydro-3-deoxy-phosphogluconate aldolase [Spirochaetota bacterium]HPI22750.1 bifunctional 4-hydroxy-2-oxoglutarate aldolase/2-dehydro-3-deoxy-phosphogluconate aldolase [Spirochaetota bacterium]HPU87578.1 bifunctional 4-hydroxy-2-oxoglutarate aldolase/2-dehydro-3-deoxy-phosphogluconate aldolase [Spirochaetota bacterium]
MTPEDAFRRARVIPVAVLDDAAAAVDLAALLVRHSLPLIEVTLRTSASRDCIEAIAARVPEICVGCGSVLSPDDLDAAMDAGARFAFAPCLDEAVLAHAARRGLPFAPGVATPTELGRALALGCALVKVFPAAPLGGPGFVRALCAPFATRTPRVVPTGGVSEEAIADYLAIPEVVAVGATFCADPALVARRDFDELERRIMRVRRAIDGDRDRRIHA